MASDQERRNSREARDICLKTHGMTDRHGRFYMVCHCGQPDCKKIIDPVRDRWRGDHIRRWAEGGRNTPDNLRPILEACDAGPNGKAARDTKIIAHGKRAGARHMGGRGRKLKGRPLAGTKASGLRKRMNGTVERW